MLHSMRLQIIQTLKGWDTQKDKDYLRAVQERDLEMLQLKLYLAEEDNEELEDETRELRRQKRILKDKKEEQKAIIMILSAVTAILSLIIILHI